MRSKQRFVGAWLSENEYRHMKRQMDETGLTASDILRRLLLGLDVKPRPAQDTAALVRQISAIGNNINQITHTVNSTRSVSVLQLKEVRELLEKIWEAVMEIY